MQQPCAPSFLFRRDIEADNHNWKVLFGYKNLVEALAANKSTVLQAGSEFRPANHLALIFDHHKLWPRLRKALMEAVLFPLDPVPTDVCRKDTIEGLKFGNHRGVEKYPSFFSDCIDDDVTCGYALVTPWDR